MISSSDNSTGQSCHQLDAGNISGSSEDESINWECSPSGDLNFFSDRKRAKKIRSYKFIDAGNEEIIGIGESSCYEDLSFPKELNEIQNPSINSVFDESESLGYQYLTNNIDSTREDEEVYRYVLNEDTTDNELVIATKPCVIPIKRSEVNVAFKETKQKLLVRPVHKKRRVKQIIFLCDNCDRFFPSNEDLEEHYDTSETCLKKYKCFLCSFSSNHNSTLKLHLAFEHNCTESFSCYHCSHITGSKKAVKKHIKVKHFKELLIKRHKINLDKKKQSQVFISSSCKNTKEMTKDASLQSKGLKCNTLAKIPKKPKFKEPTGTCAKIGRKTKNNFSFKTNKNSTNKLKQNYYSKIPIT